MRLVEHSHFHTTRLVEQIEELTDFYETGKHMYFTPPEGTRCKHVFVSALKTDSKDRRLGYSLFRTYDCPEGAKVLEGPSDPREYRISHAFGATGAAKYFTPPWKETSAKKGKFKFLDVQFPSPHNITELALDEMWGLYGTDVQISVVVNIGPGIPNASDCKDIARRFSWGKRTSAERTHVPHNTPAPLGDPAKRTSLPRHKTFGSEQNVDIEDKLRRDEGKIEDDIKRKLRNVYQNSPPPYYRLAPEVSAPRTAHKDTSSAKAISEATQQYLSNAWVESAVAEVGRHVCVAA